MRTDNRQNMPFQRYSIFIRFKHAPEERKAKRQRLSKPIMEALKLWMETECVKYCKSSQIGKAITYAYTRCDNMM